MVEQRTGSVNMLLLGVRVTQRAVGRPWKLGVKMVNKGKTKEAATDVIIEKKKGHGWKMPKITVVRSKGRDDLKVFVWKMEVYYHHLVYFVGKGLPLTEGQAPRFEYLVITPRLIIL